MSYLIAIPRRWIRSLHSENIVEALILARWLSCEVYREVDAHSEAFNRVEAVELCVHAVHVELFRPLRIFRSVNCVSSDFLISFVIILDCLCADIAFSVTGLIHSASWIAFNIKVCCHALV